MAFLVFFDVSHLARFYLLGLSLGKGRERRLLVSTNRSSSEMRFGAEI
jgi:hypothetical protein